MIVRPFLKKEYVLKKFVLALAVLALVALPADAGPIRRLIQHHRQKTQQGCGGAVSHPRAHIFGAAGGCATGACGLR